MSICVFYNQSFYAKLVWTLKRCISPFVIACVQTYRSPTTVAVSSCSAYTFFMTSSCCVVPVLFLQLYNILRNKIKIRATLNLIPGSVWLQHLCSRSRAAVMHNAYWSTTDLWPRCLCMCVRSCVCVCLHVWAHILPLKCVRPDRQRPRTAARSLLPDCQSCVMLCKHQRWGKRKVLARMPLCIQSRKSPHLTE